MTVGKTKNMPLMYQRTCCGCGCCTPRTGSTKPIAARMERGRAWAGTEASLGVSEENMEKRASARSPLLRTAS